MTSISATEPQVITDVVGLLNLFATIEDLTVVEAQFQELDFEVERFGFDLQITVDEQKLRVADDLHSRIQAIQDLTFLALSKFQAPEA
jgi:hypothetical protein